VQHNLLAARHIHVAHAEKLRKFRLHSCLS
jgi:hypothetical protein